MKKKDKSGQRFPVVRFAVGGAGLVLGAAGLAAARFAEGFADLYGFNVYPAVVNVFARISGIFPFSLAEIMVVCGVLLLLAGIIYLIVNLIRRKGGRLRLLLSSAATVTLVLGLLLFEYAYGMGINYSRKPFSEIAGLTTGRYTKAQVLETLEYAIDNLTAAGERVTLDAEGHIIVPGDLTARASAAMEKLGERYDALNSYYPQAKPVILSELMCHGHITGIFTFYSMEANYNRKNVPEEIGHTVCHELSHMTGFMREDEANYIAYLACRDSGDDFLTYCGWYDIMIYLLNAYYPETTGEEYSAVFARIPDYARKQLVMQNEFWDRYRHDFGQVAEAINDVYLKINDQSDGTKSYGRVVDLVIAEYLAGK
ncbi:MAG: DUF3810 domain-containing protein [Ruminiclostridium sp.]|nr:DUF3810 domain-containing protein [Ruminiclostridium sp.]